MNEGYHQGKSEGNDNFGTKKEKERSLGIENSKTCREGVRKKTEGGCGREGGIIWERQRSRYHSYQSPFLDSLKPYSCGKFP